MVYEGAFLVKKIEYPGKHRDHTSGESKTCYLYFPDTISLVFAGDINFSDPVRSGVKKHLYEYSDTLKRLAPYIREADVAFGNLESPFVPEKALSAKNKGAKVIFLNAEKQSSSALRLV